MKITGLRPYYVAAAVASFSLAVCVTNSSAQSNVVIYGSFDQYLNYLHSSSGATIKSLEDGAILRSRLGFRGTEDLGGGMFAKFQLEMGIGADNGTAADTTRSFDRQAWVGLGNSYGEVRLGRQNGSIFTRGGYIDFTTRTLGSMVNNFGVPSRFDNTISFISTRMSGVQGDVFVSLPETPTGNRQIVYQAGLDYTTTQFRVGYGGLRAKPPKGAPVSKDVVYDNVFANWMYGQGTVYLTYVRSNNNTSTAISNNAGTILGNVGGLNAGTSSDLNNMYHIWQLSADYQVAPMVRVGALWGRISDQSGRSRGANGGAIGAYYDFSKRTTLMALADTIRNDTNGGWRPAGSAGLKTTFTDPKDTNGRKINGLQVGILHRF